MPPIIEDSILLILLPLRSMQVQSAQSLTTRTQQRQSHTKTDGAPTPSVVYGPTARPCGLATLWCMPTGQSCSQLWFHHLRAWQPPLMAAHNVIRESRLSYYCRLYPFYSAAASFFALGPTCSSSSDRLFPSNGVTFQRLWAEKQISQEITRPHMEPQLEACPVRSKPEAEHASSKKVYDISGLVFGQTLRDRATGEWRIGSPSRSKGGPYQGGHPVPGTKPFTRSSCIKQLRTIYRVHRFLTGSMVSLNLSFRPLYHATIVQQQG